MTVIFIVPHAIHLDAIGIKTKKKTPSPGIKGIKEEDDQVLIVQVFPAGNIGANGLWLGVVTLDGNVEVFPVKTNVGNGFFCCRFAPAGFRLVKFIDFGKRAVHRIYFAVNNRWFVYKISLDAPIF